VAGDLIQHVLEKGDTGAQSGFAAAVQVQGYPDVRLTGLAVDGCLAGGHCASSRLEIKETSIPHVPVMVSTPAQSHLIWGVSGGHWGPLPGGVNAPKFPTKLQTV